MRVLCLSEQYWPTVGGTVRYVEAFSRGLARLGVEVTLVVPDALATEGVRVERTTGGWRCVHLPARGDVHGTWARRHRRKFVRDCRTMMPDWLERFRPDLVHVLSGHYLYAAVRGLRRIPTVWTVHNVPPDESAPRFRSRSAPARLGNRVHRSLIAQANRRRIRASRYTLAMAISEATRHKVLAAGAAFPVHVVPLGFTSELQAPGGFLARANGGRPRRVELLTVAAAVPHKGLLEAVRAAAILRDQAVDFRWVIAGPVRSGRYVERVQAEIQKRELRDRVLLSGLVPPDRLRQLYGQADLYVQPSRAEGFCITLLDALANGIPSVGTRVGAVPEMIELGEGRVVACSAEALARGVTEVLSRRISPEERQAAAERVRVRYSWQASAERALEIYQDLLNGGAG